MRSEQLVDQIDFQDNCEIYSCHAMDAIRIKSFHIIKYRTKKLQGSGCSEAVNLVANGQRVTEKTAKV